MDEPWQKPSTVLPTCEAGAVMKSVADAFRPSTPVMSLFGSYEWIARLNREEKERGNGSERGRDRALRGT